MFRLLTCFRFFRALLVLFAMAGHAAYSPGAEQKSDQSSPNIQSLSRSVVRIFAGNSESEGLAMGSGFFIGNKGILLTNYHVVAGRDIFAVFVLNTDRRSASVHSAVPLACDRENDLALLQVQGDHLPQPLTIGTASPKLLQKVIAVGFPGGADIPAHGYTVSDDPVSSLVGSIDNLIPNFTQGTISKITDDTIVHDCKIGPGSSGGPLLDAQSGEVIGINYAGRTDSAYVTFFFAIPIQKLRNFLLHVSGNAPDALQGVTAPNRTDATTGSPSIAPPRRLLSDRTLSSIIQAHFSGGMGAHPFRPEIYEDVLFYGSDKLVQMSRTQYMKESLLYTQNWPHRQFEILSASRRNNCVSVIFGYVCRSRRGKVARGFSHLNLVISENSKIAIISERTSRSFPEDFPNYSPFRYSGRVFFSSFPHDER